MELYSSEQLIHARQTISFVGNILLKHPNQEYLIEEIAADGSSTTTVIDNDVLQAMIGGANGLYNEVVAQETGVLDERTALDYIIDKPTVWQHPPEQLELAEERLAEAQDDLASDRPNFIGYTVNEVPWIMPVELNFINGMIRAVKSLRKQYPQAPVQNVQE